MIVLSHAIYLTSSTLHVDFCENILLLLLYSSPLPSSPSATHPPLSPSPPPAIPLLPSFPSHPSPHLGPISPPPAPPPLPLLLPHSPCSPPLPLLLLHSPCSTTRLNFLGINLINILHCRLNIFFSENAKWCHFFTDGNIIFLKNYYKHMVFQDSFS